MFTKNSIFRFFSILIVMLLSMRPVAALAAPAATAPNPAPPAQTVKLIFIHHSTGENWLRDDYGLLGKTLSQNHYFVSDTNYGWGPNSIGDRTDIPNWLEWFRSASTPTYMDALLRENEQHSTYTRTLANPGGQNTIILFKSCFPNSELEGNPNDPPSSTPGLTVGHAKYVYNELLKYFRTHPEKLFVVVTAPPVTNTANAANARAFNNWLYNNWLQVNNYPLSNVAVFDFYNVLTAPGAHHRYYNGDIQHIVTASNILAYPSSAGDDHPNVAGSQKATSEFVPLLNVFYNRWKAETVFQTSRFDSMAANDGWVLESAENSNVGGMLNASALALHLGDSPAKKQYRSILSFNTASLPDSAIVTGLTLRVKQNTIVGGGNPVSLFGGFVIEMKTGFFGTLPDLQTSDFQAPASKMLGPASPSLTGGFYTFSLINAKAFINRLTTNGGLTQIRLRFNVDDNNDTVANMLSLFSGDAPAGSRPQLVVTYVVP